MAIAKFYTADYFFKRGYPMVIIMGHKLQSYFKLSMFVIFYEVPSGKYREEVSQIFTIEDAVMQIANVADHEEYAVKTVLEWADGYLQHLRFQDYEKSKDFILSQSIHMKEGEPFEKAILRLRLRGLPTTIIDRLGSNAQDPELGKFFRAIREVRPIFAETLPR